MVWFLWLVSQKKRDHVLTTLSLIDTNVDSVGRKYFAFLIQTILRNSLLQQKPHHLGTQKSTTIPLQSFS